MSNYKRMTYLDRCQLKAFLSIQLSISEIAAKLGFHKSTISRELKRNTLAGIYSADRALALAQYRYRYCRKRKKVTGELEVIIREKLNQKWSPEQISGRLKVEKVATICHETIYRYLRSLDPSEVAITKNLRRWKKRGAGRVKYRTRRPVWKMSIDDRPNKINLRKEYGHWERDLMHARGRKRLIVCAERKSRFVRIANVKEPYCLHLTEQTKLLIKSTDRPFRSITNDNGSEFMDGWLFDVPVYYCNPRRPQERGTVENTIGLLRQYIGTKTDVEGVDLQMIENELNHRPRKCLDYRTPYEVFYVKQVAVAI